MKLKKMIKDIELAQKKGNNISLALINKIEKKIDKLNKRLDIIKAKEKEKFKAGLHVIW